MAILSERAGSVGTPYLERTDSPVITAWTMCGWFYFTSDADHCTVFGIGDASSHFMVLNRDVGGALHVSSDAGNSGNLATIELNKWCFLAITLDGANANLWGARAADPALNNVVKSYTGAWTPNSLSVSTSYAPDGSHMYASNVMVFSSVLNQDRLWQQMRKYQPVNPTLWAWWRLETVATAAKDWSGNGRPSTVTGTFKEAPEAIDFWTDYPVNDGINTRGIVRIASRIFGVDSGGAAPTVLSMYGGLSGEIWGAPTFSGSLVLAGAFPTGGTGAPLGTGVLSPAGALLYDAYGVPVVSGTLAEAGAASDGAGGAPALTGTLAPAGGASGELYGAAGLVQTLLMAGGLSEERYGAPVLATLVQMSGAQAQDLAGAISLLGTIANAGGTSEERYGAIILLQTITLLMAGAGSEDRAGASLLAATFTEAGSPPTDGAGAASAVGVVGAAGAGGEDRAGVTSLLGALAQAGGPSAHTQGAAALAGLLAMAGELARDVGGASGLIQGLISLLMAGAPGSDAAGAPSLAATFSQAGGPLTDAAGAAAAVGSLGMAGGPPFTGVGASLLQTVAQMAGQGAQDAGGGASLAGALAAAGARSGEQYGAFSLASIIALLMAGGASQERGGAAALSTTGQQAGAASDAVLGAIQGRITAAFAGRESDQAFGAFVTAFLGFLHNPVAFLYGPPLRVAFENSVLTISMSPSLLMASDCPFCAAGKCDADFHLTQDDLLPLMRTVLLAPSGAPQDLSGASVTVELQKADLSGPLFGGAVGVPDAVNGVVEYTWVPGDSDDDGLFTGQFKVIMGGKPAHWPTHKFKLRVLPKLVAA